MRRENGDPAFLYDMLEGAIEACGFVSGKSFEDFSSDSMLRAAVERKIEIMREAARSVSQALQDSTPEIAWRPIIATRNILAHDYDIVELPTVWRIATTHLPELVRQLKPLIPPPPSDPLPEL